MPWIKFASWSEEGQGRHVLKCVMDGAHETYVEKNNGRTKTLTGPRGQKVEVDVLTQRSTTGEEIALVKDEATALAVVRRQNHLAMWPDQKNMTDSQMAALAHVAFHYQMDLIMGEIMPFQGKPFITIKGRRRHDKREGHRMGITFRMPREDEIKFWVDSGAMHKGDVIQIAVGTEPDGLVTEAMGRVLESEQPKSQGGRDNLPIAIRKIEMAQKRAESRVREMVFGAIGKPQGLNPDVAVLGEGDDSKVVEGTFRDVTNEPEAQTMPDFGECPEHGVVWKVEADKFTGNPRATHFVGKDENDKSIWCSVGTVYKTMFSSAWASKFGEPVKKDVDAWLKERFDGKTWSKLAHLECVQAYDQLRVDPTTGAVESPNEDNNSESSSPDATVEEEDSAEDVPMPDQEEPEPAAAAVGDEPDF
jgi:hypothetical protein